MTDTDIVSLFSVPIYISDTKIKFTKKELSFVKKNKKNPIINIGNLNSKDSYVLEKKEFVNIKKILYEKVKDYFDKVLKAVDVEPYITQSWINYTENNQFHHKHNHPNSLVSGVFYIDADKDKDAIRFFKSGYQQIRLKVSAYNQWNSEHWWFPVSTGDLFLFPSSLDHAVEYKKGNNTRTSIAFNVFIKGNLGDEAGLTSLELKL